MSEKEKIMSAEEYKKLLIKYLTDRVGSVEAEALMDRRGDDWMEFYEEGYSVEAAGFGLITNLL